MFLISGGQSVNRHELVAWGELSFDGLCSHDHGDSRVTLEQATEVVATCGGGHTSAGLLLQALFFST